MNNIILYIIFILFFSIPAVYLAGQKNFFFIENEKNNTFLIRFIFLFPGVLSIEILFYFFCFLLLTGLLMILYAFTSIDLFGSSFWILSSLTSVPISVLTIFVFKKYILRADLPFMKQPGLNNYDLYMFMPNQREIEDSSSYQSTKGLGPAPITVQIKEISVNFSKIKGDILFTERGEFVVSTRALNVFEENCLTGYTTTPVTDKKSKQESNSYFQLVAEEL